MITLRDHKTRGHTDIGWLDSRHTFSFGEYQDPNHMGFRSLRVINDDRIKPGAGFSTHGHRDMEIISYVVEGALEHKDSMGTGSIIKPGDVQRMTAGTGITHSEFNPSSSEGMRLLQIWITPEKTGLKPSYEQKTFQQGERFNQMRLVADREGRDGAILVHQDVSIYAMTLESEAEISHSVSPDRYVWVQVVRGFLEVKLDGNVHVLREGDGTAISDTSVIQLSSQVGVDVLLFDLAWQSIGYPSLVAVRPRAKRN